MENFPALQENREMFQAPECVGLQFDDSHVICPVRGAEILGAIHPGYVLLPVAFYRELFSTRAKGKTPVFMGQISNDPYSQSIKDTFPDAVYIETRGWLEDFQTIRKAKNIVLSISTFVWLASWLSDAQKIYMPVFGIFNRKHFPNCDFLPLSDQRYEFFEFPIQASVPLSELESAHSKLTWKPITPRALIQYE